jgi:hypothetical protein
MIYTKKYLLKHLRSLQKKINRLPGKGDIDCADGPRAETYRYNFGSIEAALRKAGIFYDRKTKISKEEIILSELKLLSQGACEGATVREIFFSLKNKNVNINVRDIGTTMSRLERCGSVKKTGDRNFYIWSLK